MAPPALQSTAQGLLTFLTYGVGIFLGSLKTVDVFTTMVKSLASPP